MRRGRAFKRISILLLLVLTISNLVPTVVAEQTTTEMSFLTTQGKYIVDEQGQQVTLRGTNLGGWLMQEGWLSPLGYGAIDRTHIVNVTSNTQNGELSPYNAIDDIENGGLIEGQKNTYWQSNYAQDYKNMEFKIEFDKARTFCRLVIETDPNHTGDYLRGGAVQVSNNGIDDWKEVENLIIDDSRKAEGIITIDFPEQTAKYVVVKPTARGEGGEYWSIGDINVCVSDEYTVRNNLIRRFGEDVTNEMIATFQENWITEDDIQRIADMQMNLVRVPVYWMNFALKDGTIRTDSNSGFNKLDWLIEECGKRGIYVLIDFHGAPGGANGWASSGQAGTVPTELFVGDPEVVERNRQITLDIWRALATRYKDNPTVAAYGLLNEPVLGFPETPDQQGVKYWFYDEIYKTVREIDKKHIVVFEEFGDWSIAENRPERKTWENYMFEKHPYDMANHLKWDSQNNLAQSQLQTLNTIQNKWNVPLLVGEFCLYYFNDVWDNFLSGLNQVGISWTNWTYKVRGGVEESGGGNWGYYNSYDKELPDILHDSSQTIQHKWSQTRTEDSFKANQGFINTITQRADGSIAVPMRKLDKHTWQATASHTHNGYEDASNMLDGDMSTRWSTGIAQQQGQWIEVDLGEIETFSRVELIAGGQNDYPAQYKISTSTDGNVFTEVELDSVDIGFGDKMVILTTTPQNARYLRVELTKEKPSNWWSVAELNLYAEDQVPQSALYKNPDAPVEMRVEDLLSYMTVEEKIGQILQVERSTTSPAEVKEYGSGAVLSGGGSNPVPNTPDMWAKMVDEYQRAAMSTRLQIPILYGVDAVHGHNNVVGTTIFPHNIGLGATRDEELVRRVADITAEEVRATGVQWAFAPCLAVPQDDRWGRTYEGFAESASLVSALGEAYTIGLQGNKDDADFTKHNKAIATVKHFIGDGNTINGNDQGYTEMSEDQLAYFMEPYRSAIEAGAQSVMVSLSTYNGVKVHENGWLINEKLKGELGFEGIVVSDWNGCYNVTGSSYWEKLKKGLLAGIDMFMEPWYWKPIGTQTEIAEGNTIAGEDFIGCVKDLVTRTDGNGVPMERLDDAVRRILTVKFEAGLFENPYADNTLLNNVGSIEHREVAREAVRKSTTLLKNDNNLLPIAKNQKIAVVGEKADNIGYQCGGWTVEWQGSTQEDLTEGTTIYEGITEINGVENTVYSEDGTNISGCDIAIAVVGEHPYAEMQGDVGAGEPISSLEMTIEDQEMLQTLRAMDIPTIVIMLSGRPMNISEYLEDWDAFVAAWLPGTEGGGIADVLFGEYGFTGTLPISWPVDPTREVVNLNSSEYMPLFPYGYGLKTTNNITVVPGIIEAENYIEAPLHTCAPSMDEGGGLAVVVQDNGVLKYKVQAPKAGYYNMRLRVQDGVGLASTGVTTPAAITTSSGIYLQQATTEAAIQIDTTSGEWNTIEQEVYLQAGINELEIPVIAGMKVNKIEIAPKQEETTGNFLDNGGFESGLIGWDIKEMTQGVSVNTIDHTIYTGEYGLAIDTTGSGQKIVLKQSLSHLPEGEYQLKAQIQNTGGSDVGYFYIEVDGKPSSVIELPTNTTGIWSYIVSQPVFIPAGSEVEIGMREVTQVDTSIVIDNLQLTKQH